MATARQKKLALRVAKSREKRKKNPKPARLRRLPVDLRCVLLVGSGNDEEFHCAGSAILIGPEYGLSASHVLAGMWRRWTGADLPEGNVRAQFGIAAAGGFDNEAPETLADRWDVPEMRGWAEEPRSPFCPPTRHGVPSDVAVLELTPNTAGARNGSFRYPTLNLAPPRPGDGVTVLGFQEQRSSPEILPSGERVIRISAKPTVSSGIVVEVFAAGMKDGRYTFPCFRMALRSEHGMSGSAIFNDAGELVGILAGDSIGPDPSVLYSVGALLFPLLVLDTKRVRGPQPNPKMIDALLEGHFFATGGDRIAAYRLLDGSVRVNLLEKRPAPTGLLGAVPILRFGRPGWRATPVFRREV